DLKQGKFRITGDFTLNISSGPDERLYKAADRFLRRLDGRTGLFFKQGIISQANPQPADDPKLFIITKKKGKIELNEDESYRVLISPEKITLESENDIGALRGMETIIQLLSADDQGYYFPAVEINDKPRFPWRGLMLDVARHYLPMDVLKRNLDAMAAVKMNVLHFHLSDDQGWRVESNAYPKLHQLASDGLYYTQSEIKELVNYAADRGIRVMPEFDLPGHATAILVAYPEFGSMPESYTLVRNAGIFDATLDPTKGKTYQFLDKLFTEMLSLFPDEYIHIGGDENKGKHWKANPQIQAFMKKNNIKNAFELQTYFNNNLLKTINKLNKKMMGWEEILQPGLSKNTIIHSWLGRESLYRAASQGYQTVLSHGYYIDLLYPASDHYTNDPLPDSSERLEKEKKYKLTPEQEKLILGGEATMWSELVTPFTVDSRIWPRTAAIAERLWSPSSVKDVDDMYRRLEIVSVRLEELGLCHIKNRDVILRNLANGGDISALKILVEVIEPYKEYTRDPRGYLYKTYSPYTLMADAASADASSARIFRNRVFSYLQNPNENDFAALNSALFKWRDNHDGFLVTMKVSPVLKNMEGLSKKLSVISSIGLEALDFIGKKSAASQIWYDKNSEVIKSIKDDTEAKKNSNKIFEDERTEIMIVDAVQDLVDAANPEAAKKRREKEKIEKELVEKNREENKNEADGGH
ncbi:MAG TPA: family 20 glycosylhydrolase, partial [Cytophagaceae bacterium]|nr:family 20 glycosylhydrolase [Cytophagaceae bacterium]